MTSVLTEQVQEPQERPHPTVPDPAATHPAAPQQRDTRGPETGTQGLMLIPDDTGQRLVDLFKLLADETRLRILSLLQQTPELNVRTLCVLLDQSQPAVSHHLALMRGGGLIEMRREGKHNFYRIVSQQFEEVLGLVFQLSVSGPDQIQFQDYVLTYSRLRPNNQKPNAQSDISDEARPEEARPE